MLVSNLPGGLALHPATISTAEAAIGKPRPISIDHVERQHHRTVARSAENRTMSDKRACLVRREMNLTPAALGCFYLDVESAKANPVRDVHALENQVNRLAFLQRDFCWLKTESLGRDLNMTRRRFCVRP